MRLPVALTLLLLVSSFAVAQDAPPAPTWTTSLGAGLALTRGNSDSSNLNASVETAWDPKTDRTFKASALYLQGEAEGETQVDKTTANGRYARDRGRSFWFGELSYLRDAFKEIDYLIAPIVGAGYFIEKSEARTLTVDAGAGAAFESGSAGSDSSPAVRAGEAFEWAISPTSRFTQHLNGLWKTSDTADALYHFDAGITTTVAARAELKVSYVYDYKNDPPPDVEKGDSALFAALLYKF
jgi:putative salt-induced outer membrane protein YdiY